MYIQYSRICCVYMVPANYSEQSDHIKSNNGGDALSQMLTSSELYALIVVCLTDVKLVVS